MGRPRVKRKYTRKPDSDRKVPKPKLDVPDSLKNIPLSEIAMIRDNNVYRKFIPLKYMTKPELEFYRQGWNIKYGKPTKSDIDNLIH
jgi:hypothetical protein